MNFKDFFKVYSESKEVFQNIKTRSSKETWKVAEDIRKHPGDYPDLDILQIIKHKCKRQSSEKTGNCSIFDGRVKMSLETEESYIIIDYYEILKLSKKEFRSELEKYLSNKKSENQKSRFRLSPEQWENEEYNLKRNFIYRKSQAFSQKESNFIDTIEREESDFKDLIKNSEYSKERQKEKEKSSKETIKFWKDLLKKFIDKNGKFYLLTNEDILFLFKTFEVKTPDIYDYLIYSTFQKPKHPSEIPYEFKDLPHDLLKKIFFEDLTPTLIARLSSRDTDHGTPIISNLYIVGNARILNNMEENEYSPSKKEAHEYLKYINSVYKNKKEEEFNELSDENDVSNFPSWFIRKIADENFSTSKEFQTRYDIKTQDFSFQSWKTFRWFLFNLKSSYFFKERTIYGAGGQTVNFVPISRISYLTDEDLENGLKTSPEKAFQNSSIRMKKEWEESNKEKQFSYNREYLDTDHVHVVYNVKALKKEGERLNHCVGGYGPSCLNKTSLILSLPDSTAELKPDTLNVIQHRGLENTPPSKEDEELLSQWIELNKK